MNKFTSSTVRGTTQSFLTPKSEPVSTEESMLSGPEKIGELSSYLKELFDMSSARTNRDENKGW